MTYRGSASSLRAMCTPPVSSSFSLALLVLVGACSDSGKSLPPLPKLQGVVAAADENPSDGIVEVSLTASEFQGNLGGDTALRLLGYNKQSPGPLIQARVGDEVVVHFTNNLAEPTTIHWHGLRIDDDMDGTPRVQNPVQAGETFEYRFTVTDAGSYWYHPHIRGHEQVERGLYGPLVVHAADEPVYDAERYILLDDISIDGSGQIAPFTLDDHMVQMHGRLGNTLLTNGQMDDPVQMTAEQGHVERWRLLNPSNARTMSISLSTGSMRVIATDGGLLEHPYETDRIEIAVGQRYDIEVRYPEAGTVELLSNVYVRDESGEVVEAAFPVVNVSVTSSENEMRLIEWPEFEPVAERSVDQTVAIAFDAVQGDNGIEWRLNGESGREEPLFVFDEGSTVRITLDNQAGPEHPFHLHGQFFKVLSGEEPGYKDTVLVAGQSKVEIEAYLDNPGHWMLHCHILEHAELGMMAEMHITPAASAE